MTTPAAPGAWTLRVALAVAAVAGIALASIGINWREPAAAQGTIDALVAAVGTGRIVTGRLTGPFAHGPVVPVTRGTTPATSNIALLSAAARAQAAATKQPDGENLHDYGVALLLLGDFDSAIANLQAAADLQPRAEFLNDLAVAFHERALRTSRASDHPRALECVERAIQAQPSLAGALFTRALILEQLGLRRRAIAGWNNYLLIDAASGWANEAQQRRASLQAAVVDRWNDPKTIFDAASASDDELLRLSRELPGQVPELILGVALQPWAERPSPDQLAFASRASHAFANATGDTSLMRAVAELPSAGSRRQLAKAVGSLSRGYQLLARDAYIEAEPLLLSSLDGLMAAPLLRQWAVFALGRVRYFRGAGAQSEEDFTEVIVNARKNEAPSLEARAAWLRGVVQFTRGDWANARADYEAAIQSYGAMRDPQGVATVHVNLSILFRFLGDVEATWRYRLVALDRIPVHQPTLAHGYLLTSAVTASLHGMEHVALLFLDEAVLNAEHAVPVYTRAETLLQRAKAYARLSRRSDAEADLRAAEAQWAMVEDPAVRRRVRTSLVTAATQLHHETEPELAVREAHEAIADATSRGDLLRSAELHLYLGRALARLSQPLAARAAINQGIADFRKTQRSLSPSDPIRLSAFEPVWELFDEAYGMLAGAPDFDRAAAFETYESSRAQTLLELREEHHRSLAAIRSELNERESLVLLHQQPSALLAWIIEHDTDRRVTIALDTARLRQLTGAYVDRLAAGVSADALSREIYSMVLAPIVEGLDSERSLAIVADRPLDRIPWAALIDPATGQPALTRWSITVAPSASLAVAARRTDAASGDQSRALLVSAVAGGDGLPVLAGARDEVRQIAQVYAQSELLEGSRATAGNVLDRLKGSRIVHLSAHAQGNAAYPLLSRLLLSPEAGDVDGLTVRELLEAPRITPGTLVVLAACSTLGGVSVKGEGAIGLAWGFLAAGASTVLATLWDVNDAAVAPIFVDFHERLSAGARPADALRGAQLAAFERGDNGQSWAALQLVGHR